MNNQKNENIEVEVRGLLTNEAYTRILSLLRKISDQEEEDNKTSYFFVIENGILKISDEETKNRAKISYKLGDESKNILHEYEIHISRSDVEKTIGVFKNLGFINVNEVPQKRINFKYKGAEISIKDTPDFGPHFEIEMMAVNQEDADIKRKILIKLCDELGLKILFEQEIRDLIISVNTKHGFIK